MEELKLKIPVNKAKSKFEFDDFKSFIYTALYYAFGLFIGSYFYKVTQPTALNELLKSSYKSLAELLISNFCIYFSVFVLIVFLGFCLIGYPIINIIPSVIGMVSGIRISYYLINNSVKGVGYTLIMIIPFTALFLTVISITIEASSNLSKKLINITNNSDIKEELNIKEYMKKYLIYALFVICAAVLNSLLTFFLSPVVTI